MPSLTPKKTPISALHVLVIVASLAMTLGAWMYSSNQAENQLAARFSAARDRTVRQIVDRMSRYEDALQSGVASINAHDGAVSHEEWTLFAASLQIEEKYPGVNGIGVIYQVARADMPEFLAQQRAASRDFSVFPDHAFNLQFPITYIEPEANNIEAIGLDVAHEKNRRDALLASRDTGTARMSGPIILVQDSGHTPGFLFYAPFYQGNIPATQKERREEFSGVVYAPFVVRHLVAGVLASEFREVLFSIQDGDETLYDEHHENQPLFDPDPMFSDTLRLDMYGRNWEIAVHSNLAFRAQNAFSQPNMILAGGLIIEGLVITLLSIMARANRQAHTYAHAVTKELREKTEMLERANAEIEQFVYVASHDLKTPVRGVGLLTEALEEGIEDGYFPIGTRTEIGAHLKMIRERVVRMNSLTEGIMAFSRVSSAGSDDASLSMQTVIQDCIADFDIDASQITLTAERDEISCDTGTFRRVMENLIGNAFKYHPDKASAHVDVTLEYLGQNVRVSVQDNGKGIAKEFHDKIFGAFQTLGRADDPQSTGIGLAIVKRAVESHGHEVSVTSEPGAGTKFTFLWPILSAPRVLTNQNVA